MSTQSQEPLHLLFFPFLARSHMAPMVHAARLIAERGVRATIVTTTANARLVLPSVDRVNGGVHQHPLMSLRLVPFPAAEFGLPDGCENLTVLPLPLAPNFFGAVNALRGPLDELLRELHPDALVSDALLTWTTAVARDRRVPRLIFQTNGLFSICATNDLGVHRTHEAVFSRSEQFTIPGFPHPVKLTRAELPDVFDFPFSLDLLREAELTSYGVVVNSFYDLEPDYAEHYHKLGPRKVFLVGPVAIAVQRPPAESQDGDTRHVCLRWLDAQEDKSVVYVSFGTMSRFSEEQLRELALGLEACGHPFLWAVPAAEGEERWVPAGWERRVAGRGLVVRGWVPQAEVLSHRAVVGYVCHCGWNSILEAVCAGVPMASWPLHSEQFMNERLVVDVLRVGLPVWGGFKSVADEEKVVVPAEEVAGAVARLMGGGEEAERRRRMMRRLAEMGRRAVAERGTSYEDLGRMIDALMATRDGERNMQKNNELMRASSAQITNGQK